MTGFIAVLRRDLKLALKQGSDCIMVVAFFIVAASLFPFGVGPDPNMLARIASGIVWVSALLAAMLSLDRLFQADFEDGSLELLALAPVSLSMIVLAKATAHWLTTGLPLLVAAPLLAMMLNMDNTSYGTLVLTMALGTPTLSLIGAIGAALILGARRGGVLLSLLLLPLYIPVLIFGTGAVEAALMGHGLAAHLQILAALALLSVVAAPLAAARAVQLALE